MALTPKQERFVQEYLKSGDATDAAIVTFGPLRCLRETGYTSDPVGLVADCIAIMNSSDVSIYRKKACLLIIKALTTSDLFNLIISDSGVCPIERDDARVRRWVAQIVSTGRCDVCGGTRDLCAHHIIGWAEYPMGRADISNGQCLCVHCHAAAHAGDRVYNLIAAQSEKAKTR